MKILLFGSEGRLGRTIIRKYPEVSGYGRSLDVRDSQKVIAVVDEHRPDVVINCSALTNVEYCEKYKDECWEVNFKAVETLLKASERVGANFVHFSSNYALNPVNEYGRSKKRSEDVVADRGLVLRTDLYDIHTFLVEKLLCTSENVNAYSNKFFNPISMQGFAKALFSMLNMKGLYNIATSERISMVDFGKKICNIFELDEQRVISTPYNLVLGAVDRPNEMYLEPYNNLTIEDDLRNFRNELEF